MFEKLKNIVTNNSYFPSHDELSDMFTNGEIPYISGVQYPFKFKNSYGKYSIAYTSTSLCPSAFLGKPTRIIIPDKKNKTGLEIPKKLQTLKVSELKSRSDYVYYYNTLSEFINDINFP